MATNDATGPELFPGWSSVVHQPAEEPEETDLPSTVDIAAFSTGLSVEPSSNAPNDEESDSETDSEADSSNTGTDGSQSCSQSDSSDSESSSSQESSSRSPSPEFSVTTSQTNSLRLTIAQIRKPSPEQEKKIESRKSTSKTASSSSDSEASSDSESDSEKSEVMSGKEPKPAEGKPVAKNLKKTVGRLRARVTEKKEDKNQKVVKKDAGKNGTSNNMAKTRLRQRKTRKMASLPLSRGPSTYSSSSSSSGTTSSDSDEGGGHQQGSNGGGAGSTGAGGGGTAPAAEGEDSDDADSAMLASCSLQEIRQEDLAAILPDQQDVDAFNDFDECREDKRSPAGADLSGEGSDMELPQQAVNALIQRTTESSSEGETHAPPPPSSLYANSLLQQFVAQTQMLNAPCPPIPVTEALKPPVLPSTNAEPQNKKTEEEGTKKRRGRPKKDLKTDKAQEYCTNPNVSPDSGIQNSPDHVSSPEPTMSPNVNQKKPQKEEPKKVEKPVAKNLRNDKSTSNNNKNNKAPVLKPAPTNNKVPATTVNNKVSAPNNKLAVTANRFDRMLYANADKVLYPPRRKGGRATSNKKPPGRTARSKQPVAVAPSPAETARPVETKVAPPPEKQAKTPKTKTRTRPVLSTKNKMEIKGKYQTLKVPKLMHSKHKHKKHKKYKFKILKPIGENSPKINIEIDKLIADFVKCCAIATKQPKENVPEQILKTLKKVTKKRKTAEYSDKKKKKQSVSATVAKVSSNDQRLPLKKRHYHLLSNNDSKNEVEEVKIEVEDETKCDKAKIKPKVANSTPKAEAEDDKNDKTKVKPKVVSSTPKVEVQKSPVNAKYVPVIKSNTSVKASINNNEYESKETKKDVVSHIDEAIEACIHKFADKKVEPKTETSASEEKVNSSSNSITATTPKKRHRLEMANAAEKAIPVIKTEPAVVSEEKVEKAKPKISIESYISELKAKRNTGTKQTPEEKKVAVKEETKVSASNEEALKVTPESKKKVRKRRAINRTGFPTVKKKKKKSLPSEAPAVAVVPRSSEPRPNSCDRVPKQGEEYTKFVERTEMGNDERV
ncbi:unnamed protein product [Callosobruchus maculatus]|uniref:Uncharacterized protein n=1 Tax=Callosobruchus maculatus TaxID=64391 RepID=A0A653C333_CALMS|nr:unnamed protein product [Callosobruchus maculatus]